MRVCEAQTFGALMTLVVSLAFYGGSLINNLHLRPETSLPWGNQGPGMMTVEVTGSNAADGIYFLPEGTPREDILKAIGLAGKIESADEFFANGTGYTIFAGGGVSKISDMPAVKRLALGLPIDLNRASVEELSQVPGIGESLAAQIVELRQIRGKFESVSDLTSIRGIKKIKLNTLKKNLTVRLVP